MTAVRLMAVIRATDSILQVMTQRQLPMHSSRRSIQILHRHPTDRQDQVRIITADRQEAVPAQAHPAAEAAMAAERR
jgi:hypothetical protein